MDTISPESNLDDQYPDVIFPTTEEIEKAVELENAEKRLQRMGITTFCGSLDENLKRLEQMAASGCNQAETGLADLDKKLNGGFIPGQLIVVAGRPSMGKSAFAQGIAENVAKSGKAVLLFSLEMSVFEIMDRCLCKLTGIPMSKLKIKGGMTQADYAKLVAAIPEMQAQPIFICDKSSVTATEVIKAIEDVRDGIRILKGLDLGLVVIDYLQLLSVKNPRANREAEISEMTRALKIAARDLNVPIMALSQLNRGLENRTEKRPQMADLRESGAIEQDADVIIGLYREEVYSKNKEEAKGVAEALILKNRNGELSTIRMLFDGARFEFKNIAADGYADYNNSRQKDDIF